MTQHYTTGPWRIARTDGSTVEIRGGSRDLVICEVGDTSLEDSANAALIAAAPELLATLREALACIEKHIPATTFAPRERARAIIASATGAAA